MTTVNLSGGSQVLGSINPNVNMQAVDDDARAARVVAEALAVTPSSTFASLGNGASLTGTGGTRVIDVTGDVGLSGGGAITFNGTAADLFIIRIGGKMTMSGGSSIVLNGVTAGQILWDLKGTGDAVDINGNSIVNGTILAIDRSIIISGGVVNGQLISNGNELKLQSGPDVVYVPLVPEPGALSLLALGLCGLALARRP